MIKHVHDLWPIFLGLAGFLVAWGGVIYRIVGHTKRLDIMEAEKKLLLTEKVHRIMCQNAGLILKDHVSKEIGGLKDAFFQALRDLKDELKAELKTQLNGKENKN